MARNIDRKYHLFDAKGKTPGRLATEVVSVLRGKNKVDFAPHIDGGDIAVVVNSDEIMVLGSKEEGKVYHSFSGYPGGITSIKLKDQKKKDSRKIIEMAVYGMLPKNKLRDKMMRRLLVYRDAEHKHNIEVKH